MSENLYLVTVTVEAWVYADSKEQAERRASNSTANWDDWRIADDSAPKALLCNDHGDVVESD